MQVRFLPGALGLFRALRSGGEPRGIGGRRAGRLPLVAPNTRAIRGRGRRLDRSLWPPCAPCPALWLVGRAGIPSRYGPRRQWDIRALSRGRFGPSRYIDRGGVRLGAFLWVKRRGAPPPRTRAGVTRRATTVPSDHKRSPTFSVARNLTVSRHGQRATERGKGARGSEGACRPPRSPSLIALVFSRSCRRARTHSHGISPRRVIRARRASVRASRSSRTSVCARGSSGFSRNASSA